MKLINEYLLSKTKTSISKEDDLKVGDVVELIYGIRTTFLIVKVDENYIYVLHLFKNANSYIYNDFERDRLLTSWCKRDDVKQVIGHLDLDDKTISLFSNISK